MDQKKIVRQMIEFNKMAFDNTFRVMAILQDQSENFFSRFLERATWLPDDGKNAVNEWLGNYKKGREYFKDYIDQNYKKATDYFINHQTQEKEKSKK
ncbi:hypothetical protein DS62_11675 [Smithella sp. SC_K08D17]|nr:hypothetical protein KD27_05825 [Smithella sp. D17]KIE18342.1 hypothetical protein DS62_11675 [Smithella sp. SC_K08D17]